MEWIATRGRAWSIMVTTRGDRVCRSDWSPVATRRGGGLGIDSVAPTIQGIEVSWDRVADLFPLDPDIAYLNHGAFGVAPEPVRRAQQRLRDEMEFNPTAFFTRGLYDR